ncbi:MAG: CAP domain-containing protein [Myxococcota bacterium]
MSRACTVTAALVVLTAVPALASPGPDRREAVEDVFRRADRPPPTRDETLDAAARAALEADPDADVRRLLRAEGIHDGLLLPVVVVSPEADDVRERWKGWIRDQVVSQHTTHYGLAVDDDRMAVVFVRRLFHVLDPPGPARPGATLRLDGRLASGYAGAKAVLARPDEHVVRLPTAHFGRRMRIEIPLDAGPGRYSVEIVASGPRGTEVVALLALDARSGEARAGESTRREEAARPPGRTDSERLLSLVNHDRVRLGLPPLDVDDQLRETAREHARAMARARSAAHTLPGGRTPGERLAAAGVTTRRFHENVAMARTVTQAHEELWASPSHRMALLDPQVNRIGIGVVSVHTPNGPVLFIAEHLAER